MSINSNYMNCYQNPSFRSENSSAPLAKPISIVKKSVEGAVDTLAPKDNTKKKKVRNTAIAASSSILVLAGCVALFNPKYSTKFIEKLKTMQHKTTENKFVSKFYGGITKILEFTNNINSLKDEGFKWLCNKCKFLAKPHQAITNWFDKIGKHTVLQKYRNVSNRMDNFETLLSRYKDKLSPEQLQLFETKLAQIRDSRRVLTKENIAQRLENQENLMSNLESDFVKKFHEYRTGFRNKGHFRKNMYFWAQDIVQPTRDKVEQQGLERITTLIGNGKDKKGLYDELLEIVEPILSRDEKIILSKNLQKTTKKLQSANYSECVEYFDKKRDLILGSAPTDIVTALGGLVLGGVAMTTADSKEDRTSRLITGVLPIIAGLGASMVFTARLYSGVKGMLLGAATTGGLSALGSAADIYVRGKNNTIAEKETVNV